MYILSSMPKEIPLWKYKITFSRKVINKKNVIKIKVSFLFKKIYSLCKICLYLELFWSIFPRIWTENTEIRSTSPYSVEMRENADQNNSEYGHISRSDYKNCFSNMLVLVTCLKSLSSAYLSSYLHVLTIFFLSLPLLMGVIASFQLIYGSMQLKGYCKGVSAQRNSNIL